MCRVTFFRRISIGFPQSHKLQHCNTVLFHFFSSQITLPSCQQTMNRQPDIEVGTTVLVPKSSRGSQAISSIVPATKRTWFFHVIVFTVICGFCAGIGYAVFVTQRNPQLDLFHTEFDRYISVVSSHSLSPSPLPNPLLPSTLSSVPLTN